MLGLLQRYTRSANVYSQRQYQWDPHYIMNVLPPARQQPRSQNGQRLLEIHIRMGPSSGRVVTPRVVSALTIWLSATLIRRIFLKTLALPNSSAWGASFDCGKN